MELKVTNIEGVACYEKNSGKGIRIHHCCQKWQRSCSVE